MQKKIRYTLGKEERLKSRKIIEQLFKVGKLFTAYPFRIIWKYQVEPNGSPLQAGFTVSTKYFKKAVDRNRIRRLMKEGYRVQKYALQTTLENANRQLVIFFIYVGKEIPEHGLVVEKMAFVINRLQNIVNEDASTNN